MIRSIKIKNGSNIHTVRNTGAPVLSGIGTIDITRKYDNVVIGADSDQLYDTPQTDYINSLKSVPYMTKISGVTPNSNGMIWLLGDKSSNVYTLGDNTLHISDIAQTVDYPRIYASVYSMLRQLRLWVDAHKDTLILRTDTANTQWDNMLNDSDDWTPDNDYHLSIPYYSEDRPRYDIQAIGDATNFLNMYFATVALWNYAVGRPMSDVETRLHPEDASGMYIGANIVIPRLSNVDTTIDVTINIYRLEGQEGEDLYLWIRCPIAIITPDIDDDIDVTIPGEQAQSTKPSILDEGYQIKAPALNGDPIPVSFTCTVPAGSESHNMYTIQSVIEVIPFYMCDSSTYAESLLADREVVQGTNTWKVSTIVKSNGVIIQDTEDIKNTAYALKCISEDEEVSK